MAHAGAAAAGQPQAQVARVATQRRGNRQGHPPPVPPDVKAEALLQARRKADQAVGAFEALKKICEGLPQSLCMSPQCTLATPEPLAVIVVLFTCKHSKASWQLSNDAQYVDVLTVTDMDCCCLQGYLAAAG